jgi:hypothetical protein
MAIRIEGNFMIDLLTYMVAGVGAVGGVLLVYLVIQIYSSNSPYRDDQ